MKIWTIFFALFAFNAHAESFKSENCTSYRVITNPGPHSVPMTLSMKGVVSISAINNDGLVLLFDKIQVVYQGESKEVTCVRINYTGDRMVSFLAPQATTLIGKALSFRYTANYTTNSSGPIENLIQIENPTE